MSTDQSLARTSVRTLISKVGKAEDDMRLAEKKLRTATQDAIDARRNLDKEIVRRIEAYLKGKKRSRLASLPRLGRSRVICKGNGRQLSLSKSGRIIVTSRQPAAPMRPHEICVYEKNERIYQMLKNAGIDLS